MKDIVEKHGLWQMVAATWAVGLLVVLMILVWRLPENLAAVSTFLSISAS